TLKELITLPSGGDTSYAGLVWHDDLLWVSYYSSHEGRAPIYLAKVRLAAKKRASPPQTMVEVGVARAGAASPAAPGTGRRGSPGLGGRGWRGGRGGEPSGAGSPARLAGPTPRPMNLESARAARAPARPSVALGGPAGEVDEAVSAGCAGPDGGAGRGTGPPG